MRGPSGGWLARGCGGGVEVVGGGEAGERGGAGGDEALGGADEPVPPAAQPAAEDLLGDSPRGQISAQWVGVGRVEEVDTAFGGPVEDGPRGWLIALQSERHRAQAQPRDLQASAAKSGVFHTRTLPARFQPMSTGLLLP